MDEHMSAHPYHIPLSLTILGTIFIGLAACISLFIAIDIIRRKGWKTMMSIMIPVYILNALYLLPLTLWTYWKFDRPPKPTKEGKGSAHQEHAGPASAGDVEKGGHDAHTGHMDMHHQHDNNAEGTKEMGHEGMDHSKMDHAGMDHSKMDNDKMDHSKMDHGKMDHGKMGHAGHAAMHGGANRSMFAIVTIAVCHCGSGCLLGDIVGEWIVWGTNAMINGRGIWVEFLLDYAFALIFGILFQYWSIAPMTGEYGWKTVVRAAKADFLSLTCFEIGLFGWMAIFQFAIFKERLPMNNVVYWWMMQIGMFFGHWTAFPINWWLIKAEIKV